MRDCLAGNPKLGRDVTVTGERIVASPRVNSEGGCRGRLHLLES